MIIIIIIITTTIIIITIIIIIITPVMNGNLGPPLITVVKKDLKYYK